LIQPILTNNPDAQISQEHFSEILKCVDNVDKRQDEDEPLLAMAEFGLLDKDAAKLFNENIKSFTEDYEKIDDSGAKESFVAEITGIINSLKLEAENKIMEPSITP
jgi:hypothetical protein